MRALLPIWKSKPETASRVRQRIERVLRWAKSIGYRDGDNPAAWEILRELLPEPGSVRSVRHHPAMPINALPAFMVLLYCLTLTYALSFQSWTRFHSPSQ